MTVSVYLIQTLPNDAIDLRQVLICTDNFRGNIQYLYPIYMKFKTARFQLTVLKLYTDLLPILYILLNIHFLIVILGVYTAYIHHFVLLVLLSPLLWVVPRPHG